MRAAPTRRAFLALLATAGLAGCGFRLRQAPHYAFKTIRLAMPDTALRQQLARELTATRQVRVVTDPAQAEVTFTSAGEQRERTILSLTATGEARELELRLRLSFSVSGPGGRELLAQTEILRRMNQSYSETAALSKESEALMLYQNMQSDVVQQVVRRLGMIRLEDADTAAPPLPPASAASAS
jgi:LPS-assembly lipoprotein